MAKLLYTHTHTHTHTYKHTNTHTHCFKCDINNYIHVGNTTEGLPTNIFCRCHSLELLMIHEVMCKEAEGILMPRL